MKLQSPKAPFCRKVNAGCSQEAEPRSEQQQRRRPRGNKSALNGNHTQRAVLMAAAWLCPSLFGLEGFMAGLAGLEDARGGCRGSGPSAESRTRGRQGEPPRGPAAMPLAPGSRCQAAWRAPSPPGAGGGTAAPAPTLWMRGGDAVARVAPSKETSRRRGQAGGPTAPRLQKGIDSPSLQAAGALRRTPAARTNSTTPRTAFWKSFLCQNGAGQMGETHLDAFICTSPRNTAKARQGPKPPGSAPPMLLRGHGPLQVLCHHGPAATGSWPT